MTREQTQREQTYQLPITVIIEIMQGLREAVILRAQISRLPGMGKQEAMAHIVVDEQGLQLCVISEPHTGEKLFEDKEALRILQQCGTLTWTLQPPEKASSFTGSLDEQMSYKAGSAGPIPRRLASLTPLQMQALPSAQRQVFALVNNRNALDYIAHLLRKSSHEVYAVLLELKHKHLIDL